MKKLSAIILAALLAFGYALAFTAADLVGIWESKEVTEDVPEMGMSIRNKDKIHFYDNGSAKVTSAMSMTIDVGQGMFVDIYATLDGFGQFTAEGDSIVINLDRKSTKVDFPLDDLRVRGCTDPDQANTIREQIYKMMAPNLTEVQDEMLHHAFNNVVIEDKKMTCTQGEQKYVFIRKKK